MSEESEIYERLNASKNFGARLLPEQESAADRVSRFIRLQQASFQLLSSSPQGLDAFLKRNYTARRSEVIDGVWRPVSADRRLIQP